MALFGSGGVNFEKLRDMLISLFVYTCVYSVLASTGNNLFYDEYDHRRLRSYGSGEGETGLPLWLASFSLTLLVISNAS